MKQKNPLVSVVIAVVNEVQYIEEAILSILHQTYSSFELIVIADGSSEDVIAILQFYASIDSRVSLVIQKKNHGLTKSLNIGLNLSKGKYIARMDADDIAYPLRFEKQVAFLDDHPEIVCVGADVELISEDGFCLGRRIQPYEHLEIRRQLLLGNGGAMTHPVIMFSRDTALLIGGYDEAFSTAQDLDLFLRFSEVGRVENIKDTLLYWRQHPGSINRTKSQTWHAMKSLAINKTIDRIGSASFAEQLFSNQQLFQFPSDKFALAEYAFGNSRQIEAIKIVALELRHHSLSYRFRAISKLTKLAIRFSFQFVSKYLRNLRRIVVN